MAGAGAAGGGLGGGAALLPAPELHLRPGPPLLSPGLGVCPVRHLLPLTSNGELFQ